MATSTRRKVLLVSYFFPPAGGVSVQRMLALTKYLPRDRCEVGVLTTLNGAYPMSDPALLKRIPADVRIHRAFTPELPYHFRKSLWEKLGGNKKKNVVAGAPAQALAVPARGPNVVDRVKAAMQAKIRRAMMPDPQVVWRPFAEWTAAKLIKEQGYDTVLVTAPPFSAFRVGNALKRRFPHITLVSDFRDDWFGFYLGGVDSMASEEKIREAHALERETVERSDLVVAVTQATRNDIRARYPEQPETKFDVIANGYDPETIPNLPPKAAGAGKMVVTYVGTVYKPCSPRYFLDALDGLPEEVRDHVEARFVGRVIDEERPFVENRKSNVKLLGFMKQDDALKQMAESDYLLLIIDDPQTLSGKLFEYLANKKPILGLAPAGSESAKLVQRANAGWIAEPKDVEGIRKLLLAAYARFKDGQMAFEPRLEEIQRFERPRLAKQYFDLIDRAAPQPVAELVPVVA